VYFALFNNLCYKGKNIKSNNYFLWGLKAVFFLLLIVVLLDIFKNIFFVIYLYYIKREYISLC